MTPTDNTERVDLAAVKDADVLAQLEAIKFQHLPIANGGPSPHEIVVELTRLRAKVEEYERALQIGYEPFAVKWSEPASFVRGNVPGFWYIAAKSRRGGRSLYLDRSGLVQTHCADGHFDFEADAVAMLHKHASARPAAPQGETTGGGE